MVSQSATPEHEKLYEDALAAINLLFSDNSVSETVTRESLFDLKSEIVIMLEAIGVDPNEIEGQSSEEKELDEGDAGPFTAQEQLDSDEPAD